MLYFHAVRGADAGKKINNPRGVVRTRQNIPKPHRVRAVRGAVDISEKLEWTGNTYVLRTSFLAFFMKWLAQRCKKGSSVKDALLLP